MRQSIDSKGAIPTGLPGRAHGGTSGRGLAAVGELTDEQCQFASANSITGLSAAGPGGGRQARRTGQSVPVGHSRLGSARGGQDRLANTPIHNAVLTCRTRTAHSSCCCSLHKHITRKHTRSYSIVRRAHFNSILFILGAEQAERMLEHRRGARRAGEGLFVVGRALCQFAHLSHLTQLSPNAHSHDAHLARHHIHMRRH